MQQSEQQTLLGASATRIMAWLFVPILAAPLVVWFTGATLVKPVEEYRQLATRPEASQLTSNPAKFVDQFRRHYNDHFGMRHVFLRANAIANTEVLRQTSNDTVILGKNQWLFYRSPWTPYHWEPREYYNGAVECDSDQLQKWTDRLQARGEWLAGRDIPFYLVVAPAKPAVYPEHLPFEIQTDQPTPLDEFIAHVETKAGIKVIDLRPSLRAAKGETPLYLRLDTHWNAFGARIAHNEVMRVLKSQFSAAEPIPLSAFELGETTSGGYDLSRIAAIDNWRSVTEPTLTPLPLPKVTGTKADWQGAKPNDRITINPVAPLGRVVVIHDSFGLAMRPFVARSFRRAAFVHQLNFDATIIEAETPDLVLQVIVERQIMSDEIPDDIWHRE